MATPDPWAARLRTIGAAGLLCLAWLLVRLAPLRWWRRSLGPSPVLASRSDPVAARHLAAQIERAAWRLPFTVKCLPQAIVLSWQLRRRAIAHRVVLAVRPPAMRGSDNILHAWVECGDAIVLGELPGPWLQIYPPPGG
ncbi:MAG: lasso peptide biosynthesis B2 protein [Sphingomonadales bacterium]|nr:lasso peptide biosynthesis B2 protein [Sphingomonadaceae bacterium]MBS3931957.1 lasso peptide biosynthesis B2 protein [Sphingomonadales bacterium]